MALTVMFIGETGSFRFGLPTSTTRRRSLLNPHPSDLTVPYRGSRSLEFG